MMQSVLQFAGYSSNVFTSKAHFMQALGNSKPRLIVMDMLLSGADGRDICRELKADPGTRDIPLMMISAHPDAEETCRQAGADDFLEKPFEIDVLLNKAALLVN